MTFPSFRSFTNASDVTFAVNTISATLPTGTAVGDGMLIFYDSAFAAGSGAPTHTTPSGWNVVATGTYAGAVLDGRCTIYERITQSGDGAVTLTSSGNSAQLYSRLSYQFPHPTAWNSGITALFGLTASGTSHTMPSITTTQNRQMVLYKVTNTSVGGTFTDGSSSLTERLDQNGAAVYEIEAVTAGAVGTKAINSSVTDQIFYAVAVFNGRPDRGVSRAALQAVNRAGTY